MKKSIAERSDTVAFIILKKGKPVASVLGYYAKSGGVSVEVWEDRLTYSGHAGGWGYDKFTAALADAVIDGVELFNHCGRDKRTERILRAFHAGKIDRDTADRRAAKIGAFFANGTRDMYYLDGLRRLSTMGYQVIQVL